VFSSGIETEKYGTKLAWQAGTKHACKTVVLSKSTKFIYIGDGIPRVVARWSNQNLVHVQKVQYVEIAVF
jgi:hypothetical protein